MIGDNCIDFYVTIAVHGHIGDGRGAVAHLQMADVHACIDFYVTIDGQEVNRRYPTGNCVDTGVNLQKLGALPNKLPKPLQTVWSFHKYLI